MKCKSISVLGTVALCTLLSACHKQVASANTPPAPHPATMPATAAAPPSYRSQPVQTASDGQSSSPDAATKQRIQELLNKMQDAYFDYNKHTLRADAQEALKVDARELAAI